MFAYDMIPAIIMHIAHHPVTESIALLNVPPSRVPADALVLRGTDNTFEQEVNDRTTHDHSRRAQSVGGGLRESCDALARA